MVELPEGWAIALADGVSTSALAAQAAELAVQVSLQYLREHPQTPLTERLAQAVLAAHAALLALPYEADGPLVEPQATLVLAELHGLELGYAWVGDSRLYVFDHAAQAMTRDDSWVNDQLDAGAAPEQLKFNPNLHSITQCLGMRDATPDVHVRQAELVPGMRVLLCSDGLWNYLDDASQMDAALADGGNDLAQLCQYLVLVANASGGQDNVTVAVGQV